MGQLVPCMPNAKVLATASRRVPFAGVLEPLARRFGLRKMKNYIWLPWRALK